MGGRVAVSRTVSTTKKSVVKLQRRGSDLFQGSGFWGRQDFGVSEFFPSNTSTDMEPNPTGATQMVGIRTRDGRGFNGSGQRAPQANEQVEVGGIELIKVSGLGMASCLPSKLVPAFLSAPASAPPIEMKDGGAPGNGIGVHSSQTPDSVLIGERRFGQSGAVVPKTQHIGNDGGGVIENALYQDGGGRGRASGNTDRRAEETEEKEKTAAAIIGGLLGRLPLSKLKIVIGTDI